MPGGHLIGDHQRAVLVAQPAYAAQERGVVHQHPARRLHHRLDDDRRHRVALAGEHLRQLADDLGCAVGERLRRVATYAGGADHAGLEQDRPVGRVEQSRRRRR